MIAIPKQPNTPVLNVRAATNTLEKTEIYNNNSKKKTYIIRTTQKQAASWWFKEREPMYTVGLYGMAADSYLTTARDSLDSRTAQQHRGERCFNAASTQWMLWCKFCRLQESMSEYDVTDVRGWWGIATIWWCHVTCDAWHATSDMIYSQWRIHTSYFANR